VTFLQSEMLKILRDMRFAVVTGTPAAYQDSPALVEDEQLAGPIAEKDDDLGAIGRRDVCHIPASAAPANRDRPGLDPQSGAHCGRRTRIGVMYLGSLVETGSRDELFRHLLHPYTKALLSAVPVPIPKVKRERIVLSGDMPSPANPPAGCKFHTRCPFAAARCKEEAPVFRDVGGDHFVACHLV